MEHGRALCMDLIPSVTKRHGQGEVKSQNLERPVNKDRGWSWAAYSEGTANRHKSRSVGMCGFQKLRTQANRHPTPTPGLLRP